MGGGGGWLMGRGWRLVDGRRAEAGGWEEGGRFRC